MSQSERPTQLRYKIGKEQVTDNTLQYGTSQLKEKLLNEPELKDERRRSIKLEIVHRAFEQGFREQEDEPQDEPFYLEAQRLSVEYFGELQPEAAEVNVSSVQTEAQDNETPVS